MPLAHQRLDASSPIRIAGIDQCLDLGKADRAAFERHGAVVRAIHPGTFMELMVDPGFAPALSTWGVQPRIVGWDRPLPWVAVDDVGRIAADALAGPVPAEGGALELIGDHRSLRDCRQLLAAAGRRPRRVPMPTWVFRRAVGDELLQMWRWNVDVGEFPVTSGLMDVPTWVRRLAP